MLRAMSGEQGIEIGAQDGRKDRISSPWASVVPHWGLRLWLRARFDDWQQGMGMLDNNWLDILRQRAGSSHKRHDNDAHLASQGTGHIRIYALSERTGVSDFRTAAEIGPAACDNFCYF
jgi:hypothetical protein